MGRTSAHDLSERKKRIREEQQATKSKAKKQKLSAKEKGKKVAKGSAPGKFDSHKFKSRKHYDSYKNNFSKRPLVIERKIVLPTSFPENAMDQKRACEGFSEAIANRGWEKLLDLGFEGFEEVVYEFYSNISINEGDFRSYVRGKTIKFDPYTLNTLLNVPPLAEGEECQMSEFIPDAPIERENFDDILCNGGSKWEMNNAKTEVRALFVSSMNIMTQVWWAFVQSVLLPIQHKNTVTHLRLWCLRVLMMNQPLDVGLTIAREIKLLHKGRATLSYAGIISQLCLEAEVDLSDMVPMEKRKAVNFRWLFANLPPVERLNEPARVETEVQPQLEAGHADPEPTAMEIMQNNMRTISAQLELQYLMAPIVVEIADRLGIDCSALKNSPLMTREGFGQFQEFHTGDRSATNLRNRPSTSQRRETSHTSPHNSLHNIALSAGQNSASAAATQKSAPTHAENESEGESIHKEHVDFDLNVDIATPTNTEMAENAIPAQTDPALTETATTAHNPLAIQTFQPLIIEPLARKFPNPSTHTAPAPTSSSAEPEGNSPNTEGSQNSDPSRTDSDLLPLGEGDFRYPTPGTEEDEIIIDKNELDDYMVQIQDHINDPSVPPTSAAATAEASTPNLQAQEAQLSPNLREAAHTLVAGFTSAIAPPAGPSPTKTPSGGVYIRKRVKGTVSADSTSTKQASSPPPSPKKT